MSLNPPKELNKITKTIYQPIDKQDAIFGTEKKENEDNLIYPLERWEARDRCRFESKKISLAQRGLGVASLPFRARSAGRRSNSPWGKDTTLGLLAEFIAGFEEPGRNFEASPVARNAVGAPGRGESTIPGAQERRGRNGERKSRRSRGQGEKEGRWF